MVMMVGRKIFRLFYFLMCLIEFKITDCKLNYLIDGFLVCLQFIINYLYQFKMENSLYNTLNNEKSLGNVI